MTRPPSRICYSFPHTTVLRSVTFHHKPFTGNLTGVCVGDGRLPRGMERVPGSPSSPVRGGERGGEATTSVTRPAKS